ncbi:MAG: hypothetical protein GOMPHAMPRED_006561 [Gomphillus americanus]|uniref:Uncharacterized protein n=1 Tax=Gomphillus americanus TaxID=1940652 RepID=A0A8H3G067_9LECA|nr:MAG: hypothetical protein GOMPHAMPRED_006561 [Gomphillus americanus]
MDHVIGAVTRGISMGVAVTSEAIAGRTGPKNPPVDYTTQQHDLDAIETREEPSQTRDSDTEQSTIEEISAKFLSVHITAVPAGFQLRPLPNPVVLPQRRPRNKQRGFIRAYAPSLGECAAIDQKTFVDVISTWDQASKASPIFDVLNLACFAVGFIPGGVGCSNLTENPGLLISQIPSAVSATVGTAVMIAQELQLRYKSNKYLEQLNEVLFKPRGLFAMVMVYKPDMADEAILEANTADPTRVALVKHSDDSLSGAKKILRRLHVHSGAVPSDDYIPECAELIYPTSDNALTSQQLKLPGIPAESQQAIQNYLDRRAQDAWAHKNCDSKLSKASPPREKGYVNRFCDPDHRVNSGSIFGLLTGGTFDPISQGRVYRAEAAAKAAKQLPLTEQERHDAYMGRKVRNRVTGTPSKKIPLLEKIVRKDVLYFVVCNLPTENEKTEIRTMVAKMKSET